MDDEDELRRGRSLNDRRLGEASRRGCLIAEAVCSSALSIIEESRELRATARKLREEAGHLRRPPARG